MKLRRTLAWMALLAACALVWYWRPPLARISAVEHPIMREDRPLHPLPAQPQPAPMDPLPQDERLVLRRNLALPYPPPPPPEQWRAMPAAERLASVRSRLLPVLPDELGAKDLKLGQSAYLRIFKESSELELWLRAEDQQWKLFRTYPIACFSGLLGPKTKEGDMQAPEGFYHIARKQLNPASSYHLSFNVGYPNAYDRHHERTGSHIMVHGDVCSVGCFAMTDILIEEIYLVVEAALKTDDRTVPVHVFPFRMTEHRMAEAQMNASPHLAFWQELRPAYTAFETRHEPPSVHVQEGRYVTRL